MDTSSKGLNGSARGVFAPSTKHLGFRPHQLLESRAINHHGLAHRIGPGTRTRRDVFAEAHPTSHDEYRSPSRGSNAESVAAVRYTAPTLACTPRTSMAAESPDSCANVAAHHPSAQNVVTFFMQDTRQSKPAEFPTSMVCAAFSNGILPPSKAWSLGKNPVSAPNCLCVLDGFVRNR